jgi:hypothetical protein
MDRLIRATFIYQLQHIALQQVVSTSKVKSEYTKYREQLRLSDNIRSLYVSFTRNIHFETSSVKSVVPVLLYSCDAKKLLRTLQHKFIGRQMGNSVQASVSYGATSRFQTCRTRYHDLPQTGCPDIYSSDVFLHIRQYFTKLWKRDKETENFFRAWCPYVQTCS